MSCRVCFSLAVTFVWAEGVVAFVVLGRQADRFRAALG
jgi:hypothetical protein